MWTIIGTAIPVALVIYGLVRLQRSRTSHGAQSPNESAFQRRADTFYAPLKFYNQENTTQPSTDNPATTLQSVEEKDAAARKYLVKWESDEESEQIPALSPVEDTNLTDIIVEGPKQTGKRKSKRTEAEVKWDDAEEE